MSWLDGLVHRVRTVLRPGAHHRELEEELQFHEDLGAQQDGDRDAARRRIGNQTWYREETRRMTWLGTLDTIRQDLSHAWRGVTRSPGLTAAIVLTLGLGIGANAATFAVLDRIYLRPPAAVPEPRGLRSLGLQHFNADVPFVSTQMNHPMFREMRRAWGDSTSIALYLTDYALRQGRSPTAPRVRGIYASANYFDIVGIRAGKGRLFTADEARLGDGVKVAVVSDAFARDRLGGDSAVGRTLEIGRDLYTVVGILPRGFVGLDVRPSDVWLPLGTFPPPSWMRGPWWDSPNMYAFTTLYRTPGREAELAFEQRATAAIRAFNRAQTSRRPDTLMVAYSEPAWGCCGHNRPGLDMLISTRMGAVSLIVLLIACANVINLLLARALTRRREVAVRLALGISRGRLIRLFCLESLLLAALAAAMALLIAYTGGTALRGLLLNHVEWTGSALDLRVALFTLAVATLAGLVAGIVPALQASSPGLTGALKSGTQGGGARHRSRLRTSLVVVQAALSLVLLAGSALFVKSLRNVQGLDIGFDASQLLFGRVQFAEGEAPDRALVARTMLELGQRLSTRPGVEAVARTSYEPMQGFSFLLWYTATDSIGSFTDNHPSFSAVSPSFFRATGIRLVRGQGFAGGEDGGPAEVVVNEAMAARVWPGRDPIGECMHFNTRAGPCYRVTGIVENSRRSSVIEKDVAPQFYLPLGNMPDTAFKGTTVIVRAGRGTVRAAEAELSDGLRRAFPTGYPAVTPMTKNLEPEYRPWKLGASLFTGMGVLALLVAAMGIYSTVSYGVSQRTHEFGVRLALGARIGMVIRQVVGESLRTVMIGVAAGIALALAAGKLVAAMLYGIQPDNVVVLVLVSLTLLAVAALAALAPAWRISRVNPVSALRAD